jgi:hypothetical protein
MNIHLVTVVGKYAALLPDMLRHYQALGVTSFHVHIHASDQDDPIIEQVYQAALRFGIEVASLTIAPWSECINPMLYRISRQKWPDDWFIMADQDEFQHYSDPVSEVARYCEGHNYDYVEGCVVDRVAKSGMLEPVLPDIALPGQFPIGVLLSGALLGSVINKVVLCKGRVKVGPGQHFAHSGAGCPISEFYVPVFHYKWVADLLTRLHARIVEQQYLGEGLWQENARFLNHYLQHGRIITEDPQFHAGLCDPDYPHWPRIIEYRMASEFFRRF